jgi:hypothetical protein
VLIDRRGRARLSVRVGLFNRVNVPVDRRRSFSALTIREASFHTATNQRRPHQHRHGRRCEPKKKSMLHALHSIIMVSSCAKYN